MGTTVRMLKTAGLVAAALLAVAPGAAHAAPAWLADATTVFPAAGVTTGPSGTPMDVGMSASGESVALLTELGTGVQGLFASFRPPGGTFGAPQQIAAEAAGNAVVAVAADGTAVAAWRIPASVQGTLRYAVRPPGGSFGPAADVPGGDRVYGGPRIGVDGTGTVTIAWVRLNDDSLGATVEAVTRSASGALSTRQAVSGPNASLDFDLAVAPSGAAVISYGDGYAVSAALRDAGAATFGAPQPIGAASTGAATFVHAAIAPDGTAGAAWWQCASNGGGNDIRVRAAVRPPGGPWGARRDVSAPATGCTTFFDLDAAFDDAGVLTVAWSRDATSGAPHLPERAATTGPDATTFGPVTPIGETVNSFDPTLVRTAGGGLLLAYRVDAGSTYRMKAAARTAGGAWGAAVPIGPAGGTGDQLDGENPRLAADAAGDGVLLYGSNRNHGSPGDPPNAVLAAGFDGAGPVLSGVQIPATAPVGVAAPFTATATDVWSAAAIGWAFGDGGTASGSGVTHAFGAPGAYTTTVTATDALGNAGTPVTGTTSVPLAIVDVFPARDTTPPKLTAVSLLRTVFRVGPGATATVARTRVKTGTQIRLTVNEAATVRIAFARESVGRRVGGRCRATGPRTAKRCTRLVSEGTLTRKVKAGKIRVAFSGRVGKRALKAGRHRATITATDAAGNRATAKAPLRFRIVGR